MLSMCYIIYLFYLSDYLSNLNTRQPQQSKFSNVHYISNFAVSLLGNMDLYDYSVFSEEFGKRKMIMKECTYIPY